MQRDLSFDYLKGFLIFLVVLGHCPASFFLGENFDGDYLFVFCYSFHMPLFVFISGYFFSKKKYCTLKELIPNQFRRLIVPQFSWDVVKLLLILLEWNQYSYFLVGDTTGQTIKCVYHFITSLWYLWCIFICGILVVLAHKTKYPVLLLCGLSILMIVFYDYLPGPIFKNQQVAKQLLFFTGGVLLHDAKNHEAIMSRLFVISGIAYVFSWVVYASHGVPYGNLPIIPIVIWSMIGVAFFYNLAKVGYKYKIFSHTMVTWGGIL